MEIKGNLGVIGAVSGASVNITSAPTTNNTSNNILVRNSTTGVLEQRTIGVQDASARITAWDQFSATTGLVAQTSSTTWQGRTLTAPAAGITVTNGNGVSGNPTLVLANDLGAIEALTGTGFTTRTGTDTWAQRTLSAPAAGFTITNPAGIAGNPTFALSDDLQAVENLGVTGMIARTATSVWTSRTITGTAGQITVTNGSGVSGNPTISLDASIATPVFRTGSTGTNSIRSFSTFNDATGANSFAVGGVSGNVNLADGTAAAVVGGAANTASSPSSGVFGGAINTVGTSSDWSVIVGGNDNNILSSINSLLSAGASNSIQNGTNCAIIAANATSITSSANNSAIIGSISSQISGSTRSAIVGGDGNLSLSTANRSVMLGGFGGRAVEDSEIVFGGSPIGVASQNGFHSLSIVTTNATQTSMDTVGGLDGILLESGYAYVFNIYVQATITSVSNRGATRTFEYKVKAKNVSGTPSATVIQATINNDTGETGTTGFAVTQNTVTSNRLQIRVTGAALTTVTWQALVTYTKVQFV